MNEPEILNQSVRERREAVLLELRFRHLARAGKPIAAAYVITVPIVKRPRIVWG